jgi:hypothetical protein
MGFLEEIAEAARRLLTKDDWYYKANEPYILELRTVPGLSGLKLPFAFIVFPLGPENYKVTRVYRQSVTPTLGGLVAEERGLLWRVINISGTFGLSPKFGIDTSEGPDPTVTLLGVGILSGPAWTRRLMRNFFDKYAELKADPLVADQTQLIWHDTRTEDSWVVVPEQVEIDRTVQRRGQYPYSIQLKAIAQATLILPIPPLAAALSGLGAVRQVVAAVAKGLSLVNSAVQELSAILGEIRFFIAQIDSIFDKLDVIATSAQAFVDGSARTIAVGRAFLKSVNLTIDDTLVTMEAEPNLPNSARQMLQMASDGVDAMTAQGAAFGDTYQDAADAIADSEAGVRGEDPDTLAAAAEAGPATSATLQDEAVVRSSDADLAATGALDTGRTFQPYTGFRDYVVEATDTLIGIAAKQLGDGALWYDLALVNGLKPPYISKAGIPGTVKVGDMISIPTLTGDGQNSIAAGSGSEPGVGVLGTDIALADTAYSTPGRPSVDLALDQRTLRDLKTISNFPNFAQAIQLRVWTEQGHMPLSPGYGLRRAIGVKQTGAFLALLRISFESTVRQDSRVQSIGTIRFEVVDDLIEVDMDVVPRGAGSARSLSTALV